MWHLTLAALVIASEPVFALNKLVPPAQRKLAPRSPLNQIAEQLDQSIDAGDFYSTAEGKLALRRLGGAMVVKVSDSLDKAAVIKSSTGPGMALEGYRVDFETAAGFMLLRADTTERQLQLSQPKALADAILSARKNAVLDSVNPLFIDPRSGHWLIPTTNIIVCLQSNVEPKAYFGTNWSRARALAGMADQFVLALPVTGAEDMLNEVNRHSADSRVRWAQPDFISQEIPQTLDPLYPRQWHLHNTGQTGARPGADIHAEEAWAMTTGKSNIVIAVIDEGIQITHPDLSVNIFTNTKEMPGNGLDDDNNGFKDDVHGWNFGANNNDPNPASASANHGTHTAGLAIAVANNNTGVAGVAYGCKLLPITGLNVTDSQRAETFYYAAGRTPSGGSWRGADVISFSVTRSQSSVIDSALHWAATSGRAGKGCAIFCSSGNDASGWVQFTLTITNAGHHKIQWDYNKSSIVTQCDDTAWLDGIVFPDGSVESFESVGLPANWSTAGDTLWSYVTNNVHGNHGMIGWDGTNSHALKAGHVSTTSQQSYLTLERDIPAGEMTFNLWTSSNYTNGWLDVWLDDVYQYSDTGCSSLATAVAYPASYADTIAVGASTDFDYRADFSEYGANLDFLAPGGGGIAGIPTTDRTGVNGDNTAPGTNGNYSLDFTGTSASAPIAAGVAALVLSFNPGVTASELRAILRHSCDKVGGVNYNNGFNPQYGYGRINAFRALTNAFADLQVSVHAEPNPAVVSRDLTYTITISNAGPASASGISVTNQFSEDVTFNYASPAPISGTSRGIIWKNLPRLAAHSSMNITLTVSPQTLGDLSNTATVGTSTQETDPDNNSDTLVLPTVDLTRPVVSITLPTAGQRITNSAAPFVLKGKASDNVEVANVQVRLNNGDWMEATTTNNWANWSLGATPVPRTNVVKAYGVDSSGNNSATNSISIIYVVPSQLTLITNGLGGITRSFSGLTLEVGRTYSVTAVPGSGQVFSNWVGDVTSSASSLSFVMQSNMMLQANFIPNPFFAAKGNYNGLFGQTTNRAHALSGAFTLSLGDHGAYSASLKRGTNLYGFGGQFDVSGAATKGVKIGTNASVVNLNLDFEDRLAGTVSNVTGIAELQANRAVFQPNTNPSTALKGKYTLIIAGNPDGSAGPMGDSYGAVTVDASGKVVLSGSLSDGTALSQTATLTGDGSWPLYAPLYGGKGSLWGWLAFDTNQAITQISGETSWIKPTLTGTKYYPTGFTNEEPAMGARYVQPTNATTRVINLTNGIVYFEGGNLSDPFTNAVTLTISNRVINNGPNALSLSLVLSNGTFSGKVTVPGTTGTNAFKGALLQDFDSGSGFFLGTNQSGRVFFGAP